MKYAPYPEYRESGVEWIGKVPRHWSATALKRYAQLRSGHTPSRTKSEYWIDCTIPWFSLADVWQLRDHRTLYLGDTHEKISELGLANSAADLLPAGTVILSRTASVGFSGIMPRPMATTQDFVNWIPGHLLDSKYLLFLFRAMQCEFERLKMGSTHKTIYFPDVLRFTGPIPPIEEQIKIGKFIEYETAKIDSLIEKQQQLIALLKEKRQAVISHAVTKGLNPDAPMRDSGVEWLGKVPAHWEVKRLKHTSVIQSGMPKGKPSSATTIEMPMLRVANVQDGWLNLEEIHRIPVERDLAGRYLLREGDVLMNEGGDRDKLGRGAIWRNEVPNCIHQNHVFAIRPLTIEPEWLTTVTRADYAKFYFFQLAKQSTNLASISSTNLMEAPLVVPPPNERAAILAHIQRVLDLNGDAIKLAEVQNSLLQERRVALISAAVTGKIDVRGWKPPASD